MNYEDIKSKYADEANKKNTKLRMAEEKAERMRFLYDEAKKEREANRPLTEYNAEMMREFNNCTNRMSYYKQELEKAENEVAHLRMSDDMSKAIDKITD